MSDQDAHWEHIYTTKNASALSWTEAEARLSIALIERYAPARDSRVIDIGSGTSTLVDRLVEVGYAHITLLDVASAALAQTRRRLGAPVSGVAWILGDVTTVRLQPSGFDVWHDRATFHFLTAADDRARYAAQLRQALAPGGVAIIATFAEDGPTRCSGLDVVRYSSAALAREFGPSLSLIESCRAVHVTPAGRKQMFVYCVFRHATIGK